MRPSTLILLVLAIGCQPRPASDPSPAEFRAAVAGVEWTLRELRGGPAPLGAGGQPATLRFETDTARVGGFAGCNRYFGGYTLEGRAIRFSDIGMTRMACAEGMELEQQFAEALAAARRYELGGGELTLVGDSGPVARFRRSDR